MALLSLSRGTCIQPDFQDHEMNFQIFEHGLLEPKKTEVKTDDP